MGLPVNNPVRKYNMKEQISPLIAKSYSEKEALKYQRYQINDKDMQDIVKAGKEVLRNFPLKPNCCAPMSAIWTGIIRDHCPHIPIYTIAGSLDFKGRKIFGGSENNTYYEEGFSGIKPNWDGHCWIVVGDYIGDASFLHTARQSSAWLKEMVMRIFESNAYLIIDSSNELKKLDLHYTPHYVPTTQQIDGLILSIGKF